MKNPAEIVHGPMLIGYTFNVLLLGMLVMQVYIYYTHYKSDRIWMKLFVASISIANIMNTVFDLVYIYQATIVNFGDVPNLFKIDWLVAAEPTMTVAIVLAVQCFFAWRTVILTKSWLYSGLIILTAITSGVGGLWTAVNFVRKPSFLNMIDSKAPIILWLVSGVVCDILIAAVLTWYLHKTGFQRSDVMIDRIIRAAVQTGVLTVTVAVVDLIVYLNDAGTGMHLIFNLPLCKVFSNSLMSSLNSRRGWKYGGSVGDDTHHVSSSSQGNMNARPAANMKPGEILDFAPATRTEVFVHVESHALNDMDRNGTDHSSLQETQDKKARQDQWM